MSHSDRIIGIVLGLVVGIVALILFIFLGSEGSIDAPSIDSGSQTTTTREAPPP